MFPMRHSLADNLSSVEEDFLEDVWLIFTSTPA